MSQPTKKDMENELRGVGIEGSMSRSGSLGAEDPRHRRGPQRELGFHQRFNTRQFELVGGLVNLRLTSAPRTKTIHLDFAGRDTGDAVLLDQSTGLDDYAAVITAFETGEYTFLQWPIPPDLDRTRPIEVEIGYVERNATPSALASWDLDTWFWEKGQTLTRASDKTYQVIDRATEAQNVDTRDTFTIEANSVPRDAVTIKFRLTRQTATSGNSSGLGLHEALLTYPVRHYHVHE